ncbi:MAG: PDZ domain-containing protein [Calditrichaceae bacterium]
MPRFPLIIALSLILFSFATASNDNWQNAVKKIQDKIVLVEYFEQISTSESIIDKSRMKKHVTGLLVDDNGLIMTPSSIFRASLEFSDSPSFFTHSEVPKDIMVKFPGGNYQPAEFVGKDDDKGVGFIRLISKPAQRAIRFNENAKLKLGSRVLIVSHLGSSYDYEMIINESFINAILKKPSANYLAEYNIRNLSGFGLVLDDKGKPSGIIQIKDSQPSSFEFDNGQSSSLSEISPYSVFKDLIVDPPVYKEKETSRKKWLGIYMQPFTRSMAKYYKNPDVQGILINTVMQDSPADDAGLLAGDVITSIANFPLYAEENNDLEVLRKLIRNQTTSPVAFKIFRDGKHLEVPVTLSDIPISQFLADEISNSTLGFSIKELTKDIILAKQLDFDTEGVWVSKVERAGWADIAGISVGDLILMVNEQKVNGPDEMKKAFDVIEKTKPSYLSLFVKRGAETQFLFIKTNFNQNLDQ